MTFSVNYNYAAALAVQTLNATQESLENSLRRTSSGLRVQTAADDAVAYSAANVIKGQQATNQTVLASLKSARQALDMGLKTGNQVASILDKLTALTSRATDPTLTTDDLATLNTQYQALVSSVSGILGATTNTAAGLPNMLTANSTYTFALDSVALASTVTTVGARLPVVARNWGATGTFNLGGTLSRNAAAITKLTQLVTAKTTAANDLGTLGAAASTLDVFISGTQRMIDGQKKAIGLLVDADMGEESAAIQSLQIKQQLNTQAVSIANSAPKVLLTLFGL
jgi:flagellin